MSSSVLQSAKEKAGSLIVMGFSGIELPTATATFLREASIGGIIYFTQNYESPAQITELTNQIQEGNQDAPLWISVDHEGGKVQRFRTPFTRIPDAATLAASRSPKLVFEIAEVIAKELAAVGVNLNYAPVADINTNPKNPVIGARAFGDTEEEVSRLVTAMVRGHLVHGVQPCVKHFPGHGDTSVDSHYALPKVSTTLEVLRSRELRPFAKAFKSGCNAVMMAHVLLPELDTEFPGTLSPTIIQNLLRTELRYQGLIFSDDMEMMAITKHFGAEEAPILALKAGCDQLIYRSEPTSRAAYESIVKALENGSLPPEVVLRAAERVEGIKRTELKTYSRHRVVTDATAQVGTLDAQAILDRLLTPATSS